MSKEWVTRPWYQNVIYGTLAFCFILSMVTSSYYNHYNIPEYLNILGFCLLIIYQFNNKWMYGLCLATILTLNNIIFVIIEKERKSRSQERSQEIKLQHCQ